MKKLTLLSKLIILILLLFTIGGYGQCIYKFVKCDFDPIGKSEIIYGIGTFTGTGVFIGWFDIEDK